MRQFVKYVWKWIAIAAVITAFVIVTPPQPTAEAGVLKYVNPFTYIRTGYQLRERALGKTEVLAPLSNTWPNIARRFVCTGLMGAGIWYGATHAITGQGFYSIGGAADHIFNTVPVQFGQPDGDRISVVNANCIDKESCSLRVGYDDTAYLAVMMRDALASGQLGVSQPFQVMPLIRAYGLAFEDPNRSGFGDLVRSIDWPYAQSFIPTDGTAGIPFSKEEIGWQIDRVLNDVGFQNMLMHSLITDLSEAYHPARNQFIQKDGELRTAQAALEALRRNPEASASEIRGLERQIETLSSELETLSAQLAAAEETIRQRISERLGVEVTTDAVRNMITSPVGSSLLRHLVAVSSFKQYVQEIRTKMQEIVAEEGSTAVEAESRLNQLRSYTGTYALTTRIMAVAIQDYMEINEGLQTYFDGLISESQSLIAQAEEENRGLTQADQARFDKNVRDIAVQRDLIRIATAYKQLLAERNSNLQERYNELIELFGTLARDVAHASLVADLVATIESMETTAEAMDAVLSDNPQNFFSLSHYISGVQGDFDARALELFERRIRTDIEFR